MRPYQTGLCFLNSLKLHAQLLAAGIPHEYEEFEGSHEWAYWEEHLEDSLLFFGDWISAAGRYDHKGYTNDLCLMATTTLLLTVSQVAIAFTMDSTICLGDSILFDGQLLTEEGEYREIIRSTDGCDSMTTLLRLKVQPPAESSINTASICYGDSLQHFGIWYSESGNYFYEERDLSGCVTKLDELVLTVGEAVMERRNSEEICFGDSLLFAGRYLKEAGSYADTLKSNNNCDSTIAILELSLLPEYVTRNETIMLCYGDSVMIDNINRGTTGLYVYSDYNATRGCKTEEIQVNLIVSAMSIEESRDTFFCPGDLVIIGNETFSATASAQIKQTTALGCDSLEVNYNLIFSEPARAVNKDTVLCASELLIIDGTEIILPYQTIDTMKNRRDCDSIYVEHSYEKATPIELSNLADTIFSSVGDTVTVDIITANIITDIVWDPIEQVDNPFSLSTDLYVNSDETYSIYIQDEHGCDTTLSITIITEAKTTEIYIPNIISTTSESIDNTFYLQTDNDSEVNYDLSIYDRWGNLMYIRESLTANDASSGWDGRFNNQLVAAGVYVYLVKVMGEEGVRAGSVTVVR